MEKNLLKYIWKHSRRQQIIVVAMTFVSFPILYLSLELPKWIINDALSQTSAPKSLFGWQLDPVPFLAVLCLMLLSLVILGGVLKMRVNTFKGMIGERLIRRLRYTLIQNTLRFPLSYFSHVSSGEVISTVTAETEPLGGYIGESIALPLFQGGNMITILIFMFAQDWVFGLISVALIPVQGYLIPKLQQQINLLRKERVRKVRKLSERISETVAGATEIRLHGTQPYTLSEYSRRLGDLFQIRLEIFKKKFFMKFLNNTIGQITPFLFYLFGGYLVIQGDLTIGALVAAIAAYKDLTSPWRELLNFYQLHEDSKIKYQQIVELFNPDQLVDVDEVETVDEAVPLKGDISMKSVAWRDESGETVLSGITLDIPAGSMIAITGDYAVRRARLAHILAGIEQPYSGTITIDGTPTQQIPDSILRRRLALQGPDPHMFVGTISENFEYGLMQHEPDHAVDEDTQAAITEAQAAGNRAPLDTGWLDYRQAGEPSRERATDWLLRVVHATGSSNVVSERRLFEVFDPQQKPELASRLLVARAEIKNRLNGIDEAACVSLFDPDVFNPNASIAENILFGVAVNDQLDSSTFDVHPYLRGILKDQNLTARALDIGFQLGRYLLKGIDDNTIDYEEIEHFSLDDDTIIDRIRHTVSEYKPDETPSESAAWILTSLYLLLVPERHGFIRFSDRMAERVVQARHEFRENLPDDLKEAVYPFDEHTYNPKLTVKDNLLFGRMSSANPAAERVISRLIQDVISVLNLDGELMQLLGESQVGIRGSRLPTIAIHRISLGRSLLKKPSILIFHDALAPFDTSERVTRRKEVRALLPDSTIIWIAKEVINYTEFDKVYAFSEQGPLLEVGARGTTGKLLTANGDHTTLSSNPAELIANSILFGRLSANHQQHIANHSRVVNITAGACIYEVDDNPDSVWLVVSGEVITRRRGDQNSEPVGRFRRPEVFGALDVLGDCPRIMSASTTRDSVVLRIDASAIEAVLLSDATVSRTLLRALSTQWRN